MALSVPMTTTPSEVIARFGGRRVLAKKLGLTTRGVAQWSDRGWIPGRWHLELLDLAISEGVPLLANELRLTMTGRGNRAGGNAI